MHHRNFQLARRSGGISERVGSRAHSGRLRATAHPADHPESRTSTLTGHSAAVVLRDGPSPRWLPRRRDAAFAASSSEASSTAPRALAQARRGALRRGRAGATSARPRRARAAGPRERGRFSARNLPGRVVGFAGSRQSRLPPDARQAYAPCADPPGRSRPSLRPARRPAAAAKSIPSCRRCWGRRTRSWR